MLHRHQLVWHFHWQESDQGVPAPARHITCISLYIYIYTYVQTYIRAFVCHMYYVCITYVLHMYYICVLHMCVT